MKICWDNLEKLKYVKKSGLWYYKSGTNPLEYIENCEICKEPFLSHLGGSGKFCGKSCKGKTLKHSKEAKEKVRKAQKNNTNWVGRKHSESTKRKMSESRKGRILSDDWKRKLSEVRFGKNNSNWKGGYRSTNLALYDTYANQISYAEEIRRDLENEDLLQAKCAYCGQWYTPDLQSVCSRIKSLNGNGLGECRLYCSKECKKLCPTYKKVKYSAEETNTKQLSREVQPELRQMVFERDEWTCIKCGRTKSLQCHHIEGILWNPIESADIDICVTFCVKCHKEAHKDEGCRYYDLQCKN